MQEKIMVIFLEFSSNIMSKAASTPAKVGLIKDE